MPAIPVVYYMKTLALTLVTENNTNKKPRLVAGLNLNYKFQFVLLPLGGTLSDAAACSYVILCNCDNVYPL